MENQFLNDIENADMVLIGIGEEFEEKFEYDKMDPIFQRYFDQIDKIENEINLPGISDQALSDILNPKKGILKEFIKAHYINGDKDNNMIQLYKKLEEVLNGKNYFIVSLCRDGYIHRAGFKIDRVVTPCGNYNYVQCNDKCTDELRDAAPFIADVVNQMSEKDVNDIVLPKCDKCGSNLVFNHINARKYNEKGYIDQWNIYTKWLQGTLNRKVCIVELGVSLQYPTVVRWPFEKIAFLNQKASFYRINKNFYQINDELADKGISIQENAPDFLWKKLS